MKVAIRPLRLSKETLCPLSDENLLVVQGGMPTPGFTTDCPDPSAAGTCATCLNCLTYEAACTSQGTGTGTSVHHPTTV